MIAAIDGVRFVMPLPTIHARPNPRYYGRRWGAQHERPGRWPGRHRGGRHPQGPAHRGCRVDHLRMPSFADRRELAGKPPGRSRIGALR
nr:hypothetical protein [Streptomyces sp. NEAU-HV9]